MHPPNIIKFIHLWAHNSWHRRNCFRFSGDNFRKPKTTVICRRGGTWGGDWKHWTANGHRFIIRFNLQGASFSVRKYIYNIKHATPVEIASASQVGSLSIGKELQIYIQEHTQPTYTYKCNYVYISATWFIYTIAFDLSIHIRPTYNCINSIEV